MIEVYITLKKDKFDDYSGFYYFTVKGKKRSSPHQVVSFFCKNINELTNSFLTKEVDSFEVREISKKEHLPSTKTDEILEDIQEANIKAGGRFIRRSEFAKMRLIEVLHLLTPNNVKFKVYHEE